MIFWMGFYKSSDYMRAYKSGTASDEDVHFICGFAYLWICGTAYLMI